VSGEAPPPPTVDLSGVPESADVQSIGADGKPHPVHARLLTDTDQVAPGGTFRLGLHIEQLDEWHTYWKSPGDIGLPTDIIWSVPEGATTTPYEYPVPLRFEQSEIISFGYDGQVLLFTEVTLPTELPAGTIELGAEANWLVCKTSCIPGSASLKLPLTVGEDGGKNAYAALFDHYAAQHPVDLLTVQDFAFEGSLSGSAVQANKPFKAAFLLTPTGGAKLKLPESKVAPWPTFTPIVGFDWMVNGVEVKSTDQGGILVVLEAESFEPEPLPTDAKIGGLFQVKVGNQWIKTEATIAMPWAAADATVEASTSPLWALASGEAPPPEDGPKADPPEGSTTGGAAETSLISVIGLALLGGLLLNIMPCVLPVLALKLYGLIEQQDISQKDRQVAGLAYTGGILFCFWLLAGAVFATRSALGIEVGWGFQFQYPPYIAGLATLVFAFGLSLFGVFEIPAFGVDQASRAASKEGPAGYFFPGMFAPLVAPPCTAPFMGTALAFAFAAPGYLLVLVFSLIGLGLAAPFLLIAFVPTLYRFLPRPGAWMEAFKQFLGFTLIATTIWLVGVLGAQIGADRNNGFLAFLMFVALGSWVFGRWGGLGATGMQQLKAFAAGMVIAVGGGWFFLDLEMAEASQCDDGTVAEVLDFEHEVPWQPFSEERVAALAGKPIFIDFTADWCLTCKANEKAVINTAPVREVMRDRGVIPLMADWTRRDPVITEWLQRHGKAGVPFYLVLPADAAAAPIPLPEVITKDMVIEALKKATPEG